MGMLDGRVAIVTGAGKGIGRGEALALAAAGAAVLVNDLGTGMAGKGADKRVADEVVEIIRGRGGKAAANYDDVADWNGAKNAVDHAIAEFGALDVLVNNAGIIRDRTIVSMTETEFDSVVRVHLKGTFACLHHAAVYWRNEAKAGRPRRAAVVNTTSSAGLLGNPGQANYGAAKAGIAAMTIIASLELERYGVRVNAVTPGGMTRMVAAAMGREDELREPDEYTEFHPMNPANVAPTVVWLASDRASHVTGQVFRAVGNAVARYDGWKLGPSVEPPGEARMWTPEEIGPAVDTRIFGTRASGMSIGG
jgi:NAD(P)-dependent dehydrogenase (short-subunit alcohol dehydrogenase family)